METEHAGRAKAGSRYAIARDAKGMRRVIDDRNAVLVGNLRKLVHIAQPAVYVHGQNGAG